MLVDEQGNISSANSSQQHRLSSAQSPQRKLASGHRSIAVYLFEEEHQRFMGTVGVPERYPLPTEGQIVEIPVPLLPSRAGRQAHPSKVFRPDTR